MKNPFRSRWLTCTCILNRRIGTQKPTTWIKLPWSISSFTKFSARPIASIVNQVIHNTPPSTTTGTQTPQTVTPRLAALRQASLRLSATTAIAPITDTPAIPQRPNYTIASTGGTRTVAASKIGLPTVLHVMLCLSQYLAADVPIGQQKVLHIEKSNTRLTAGARTTKIYCFCFRNTSVQGF